MIRKLLRRLCWHKWVGTKWIRFLDVEKKCSYCGEVRRRKNSVWVKEPRLSNKYKHNYDTITNDTNDHI